MEDFAVGTIEKCNVPMNTIIPVRFQRLHPDVVLPKYAQEGDACMDLVAVGWRVIIPGVITEYKLGWAVEVPIGHVMLIFPRSSISETCQYLANAVGVIDSGYRGPVTVRFRVDKNSEENCYEKGDRVAQAMIIPIPTIRAEWAEALSETERGSGGYGSTGK